jgi:competence protein ComGC
MGRRTVNKRRRPKGETSKKSGPRHSMIFAQLQKVSSSFLPLRRQQIRWECLMAVLLISLLFLLSFILIPTPYSSMTTLLVLGALISGIPVIYAWRLLTDEKQLSQLIASDQQQKAQLLEQILSQTHICHILTQQARIFGVRKIGDGSIPHGPVCTLSIEEFDQVRNLIHSNCIHQLEKSQTSDKGLTLVELLGIVAIISLLLLIAIPSILGVLDATNDAALKRRVQTLNFAVEQARLRKYDPVLDSTDKYAVYQYLIDNNFLIKGQSNESPDNPPSN